LKKNLIILLFCLLFSLSDTIADEKNTIWYYGERAGMRFSSEKSTPEPLLDGGMAVEEGCATLSDSEGNLILYTDGKTVWNRNHNLLKNGSDLKGYGTATQSTLIIPNPEDPRYVYIFTLKGDPALSDSANNDGLCYSIVDMSQDFGFGAVTVKKNIIVQPFMTEHLTSVHHADGKSVWVIAHKHNSNKFLSILVNKDGVSLSSRVESPAGLFLRGESFRGQMKVSPDGNYLAIAHYSNSRIELFNFDTESGIVRYINTISAPDFQGAYGIEFSQNSQKLYAAGHQFDMSTGLKTGTEIKIPNLPVSWASYQLAPDGRIYVSDGNNEDKHLGVINFPDRNGINCDYDPLGFYAGGNTVYKGLPAFAQSDFALLQDYGSNSPVCVGETAEFYTDSLYGAAYEWYLVRTNELLGTGTQFEISNVSAADSGYYMLRISKLGTTDSEFIYLMINPIPEVSIETDDPTVICSGQEIQLRAEPYSKYNDYLWTGDLAGEEISIDQPGEYTVRVTDQNGCVNYDTLFIEEKIIAPEILIRGNHPFCYGDSVQLYTSQTFSDYIWSTAETGPEIWVKTSSTFTVTVYDSYGCEGISEIITTAIDPGPDVQITGKLDVCEDSEYDYILVSDSDESVTWSVSGGDIISSQNKTVRIKWHFPAVGQIKAIQKFIGDCSGRDSVEVNINAYPEPNIMTDRPYICGDDGLMILHTDQDYMAYKWSTGEESASISVSQAGDYYVTVTGPGDCESVSETISIDKRPLPIPIIAGDIFLCEAESTLLWSFDEYEAYLWSNGSESRSITVYDANTYSLTVTDSNLCQGSTDLTTEYAVIDLTGTYSIDFGIVEPAESPSKTIRYTNTSNVDILISEAAFKYNQAYKFTVDPELPVLIPKGGYIDFTVHFDKLNSRFFSDSLIIQVSDPCMKEFSLYVQGTGTTLMIIRVPNTTINVGEDTCIPILAQFNTYKPVSAQIDFYAQISFDLRVFYPDEAANASVRFDTIRIVEVIEFGKTVTETESVIGGLCGFGLLSEFDQTSLVLENVSISDTTVTTKLVNGNLNLTGVCAKKIRLVKFFNLTEIKLLPDPPKDNIHLNISSEESGSFALEIYTIEGKKIKAVSFNSPGSEIEFFEKEFNFPIDDFANGAYRAVLRSPGGVVSVAVNVLK
jgi:hypothetical protein